MAGNGWPRCLRPLSNGLSWRIRCGDLKEMALEKRIFIRAFFDEGGEPLLAFASGFRYYPKKTAAGILASGDRWMNAVFPVFRSGPDSGRKNGGGFYRGVVFTGHDTPSFAVWLCSCLPTVTT